MSIPGPFMEVMVALATAYDKKLSEAQTLLYYRALRDVPKEDLRRAAEYVIRERSFFPSVADIWRAVYGSVDDRGVVAWNRLLQAAERVGAYRNVSMDAVAAMALTDVFGSWERFCQIGGGAEEHVKRGEFLAAYRAHAQGAPAIADLVVLPGACGSAEAPVPLLSSGTSLMLESGRGH